MLQVERADELVVLMTSQRPTTSHNQFVLLLGESMPPGIKVTYFGWKQALFGHYDVVHAHWPEALARGSTTPRRYAKQLLFGCLLLRLTIGRIPVVRTLHNTKPHEATHSRVGRLLGRMFDRRTVAWIRLNGQTPTPDPTRTFTIPHGHYPSPVTVETQRVPGRLLYFGFIRPYKKVPALVEEFIKARDQSLQLRIVGKPVDEAVERSVRQVAGSDPRVLVELVSVPMPILESEIASAELVVLPYAEMHNSGALLHALSLSRPVLVPRNQLNEELAAEVGAGWVIMYDGEITTQALIDGLNQARSTSRHQSPNLRAREWRAIGEATAQVYRRAVGGDAK